MANFFFNGKNRRLAAADSSIFGFQIPGKRGRPEKIISPLSLFLIPPFSYTLYGEVKVLS
jgi:hypothetical protein